MSEFKFKVGDLVVKDPNNRNRHPRLLDGRVFKITSIAYNVNAECGQSVTLEDEDGNWTVAWFTLDKNSIVSNILRDL